MRSRLTRLRNVLVHRDEGLQLAQEGMGLSPDGQRRMLHEHHTVHVLGPLLDVQRRVLVRHAQRGVAMDGGAVDVQNGVGAVALGVAVEQLQGNGVDAHRHRQRQIQGGLDGHNDRVRARLHDVRPDEQQGGIIDDALGDGGNDQGEAIRVRPAAMQDSVPSTLTRLAGRWPGKSATRSNSSTRTGPSVGAVSALVFSAPFPARPRRPFRHVRPRVPRCRAAHDARPGHIWQLGR